MSGKSILLEERNSVFEPCFVTSSRLSESVLVQSAVNFQSLGEKRMKSFVGGLAVAVLAAGSVFAGGAQKIQGHLVDVACASENAAKPKPGFAAKHSKDCLQMA